MIRLTVPSINEEEVQAVRDVLLSGYLVQGPKVAEFERAIAEFVGSEHAIAVSSCTAALHLALVALGIGPGDIVVTTAYSWPATANVIELCGAQPVFVDVEPDTYNLDPNQLESTLSHLMCDAAGQRVKAVLPVHTFGQMADMPAIIDVARRYDIPVIEDAACALGAKFNGRPAGKWGVMGCFSFHPRKAITTGEGGMIVTDELNLACKLRALRNHGQDPLAMSPDFVVAGFNYRMTELQGALGVVQMAKLDRIIGCRRRAASHYNSRIREFRMKPPTVRADAEHVYQSYVVLLSSNVALHRQELISSLRSVGIETTIGTWNIPATKYYRSKYGYSMTQFANADLVFKRSLSLPMHDQLTVEVQNKVVDEIRKLIANATSR